MSSPAASHPGRPAPSLVVAGGGTAGHIEPAMNLADAVLRLDPHAQVTALGTTKGLDRTLIPARGYPLELIPPVPLPRQLGRELLSIPGRVRAAVAETSAVLQRVRADVVVGFGGYVAVPAYLAARQLDIPIVVHEANAKPGLANRAAARMTPHVFVATAGNRLPHATAIGIPLRPSIADLDRPTLRAEARERFGLDQSAPTLLVTGGSQGAQVDQLGGVGGGRWTACGRHPGAAHHRCEAMCSRSRRCPTPRRMWSSATSSRCNTPMPLPTSRYAGVAR